MMLKPLNIWIITYLYHYATQLGFDNERFDSEQLLGSLSGGEKIKLQFIKLLALNPQLILLDEPSNDLDLETLQWLAHFLKQTDKTMMLISHDEWLFKQVANRLLLFDTQHHKKITKTTVINLDYATFVLKRAAQFEKDLQIATKQRSEHQKQRERQQRIHQTVEHQVRNTHDAIVGRLVAKKMKNVLATQKRLEKNTQDFKEIPVQEEAILVKLRCHQPLSTLKVVLDYQDEAFCGGQCQIRSLGLRVLGQERLALLALMGLGKVPY